MNTIHANELRQRGMTLIELMISLLLSLIVVGGVLQIFTGNRETYTFNEGLARIQESGRIAIETLNRRLRMAGYLG